MCHRACLSPVMGMVVRCLCQRHRSLSLLYPRDATLSLAHTHVHPLQSTPPNDDAAQLDDKHSGSGRLEQDRHPTIDSDTHLCARILTLDLNQPCLHAGFGSFGLRLIAAATSPDRRKSRRRGRGVVWRHPPGLKTMCAERSTPSVTSTHSSHEPNRGALYTDEHHAGLSRTRPHSAWARPSPSAWTRPVGRCFVPSTT